jgi:hypothetical protein
MFETFKKYIVLKLGYTLIGVLDKAHPTEIRYIYTKIKHNGEQNYFKYKGRTYILN